MPSAALTGPPRDVRRPELPYLPGLRLSIRRHIPPEPFGPGPYLKTAGRGYSDSTANPCLSHVEWCLQHPLLETPPHRDQVAHRLRVVDQVACEDGRGAQIVRCHLDRDNSRVYVAKIYDPLYYHYCTDANDGLSIIQPDDVTWFADMHYSREAWAYQDLKTAGVDGVFSPRYYGSWTFNVPLHGSKTLRPVRMVLMEWIPGITMASVLESGKFRAFSPQHRLDIFARVLEAQCKLAFYGVRQNDVAPRNVILSGDEMEVKMPRVSIIDFNIASVVGRPSCLLRGLKRPPLPISPRHWFWNSCPIDFEAWVPRPHNQNASAFKGWLNTQWGTSKDYAPYSEEYMPRINVDGPVEMADPLPDPSPGEDDYF